MTNKGVTIEIPWDSVDSITRKCLEESYKVMLNELREYYMGQADMDLEDVLDACTDLVCLKRVIEYYGGDTNV